MKYISGKRNIADSLSRLLSRRTENTSEQNGIEDYVHSIALALSTKEIERASEMDEELCDVRRCLLSGQWERSNIKEYLPVKNKLCAIGQVILHGTRIVISKSLGTRVLEFGHEGHPCIVVMKRNLRSKVWWPGIDINTKDVERECHTCYGCHLVGIPAKPEPMHRTQLPSAPLEHLIKQQIFWVHDLFEIRCLFLLTTIGDTRLLK